MPTNRGLRSTSKTGITYASILYAETLKGAENFLVISRSAEPLGYLSLEHARDLSETLAAKFSSAKLG